MEFHPLANVLPMMDETAFAELVSDIEAHGLREPVMVYEGKILDGRNRFRACEKLGIPADLEYLNGEDPVSYVISMNVRRRHLTTSQRAMIAAELATMKRGGQGSNQYGSKSAKLRNSEISQPEAAKLLNVSQRSVQTAAYVRDHGTDEERADVINGERKASRVAENIRVRLDPEKRERRRLGCLKQREPGKLARKEKALIQTVIIASQQISQAAETLEAIDAFPPLGERTGDVIKDLRASYTSIGRVVRCLEFARDEGGQAHG